MYYIVSNEWEMSNLSKESRINREKKTALDGDHENDRRNMNMYSTLTPE